MAVIPVAVASQLRALRTYWNKGINNQSPRSIAYDQRVHILDDHRNEWSTGK